MRRGRVIAAGIVLVLVVLVVATAVLVRNTLSPERFTALLRSQAEAAGLRMTVRGPAQPTLWPRLAVRIEGLQLRRNGFDEVMLAAREVLLVVPWGSLLRGEAKIDSLRIQAPRIDLAQVRPWLDDLQGGPGKPQLPRIATGVRISAGTVTSSNTLLLKSLQLETGELVPGQPFALDLQGLDANGRTLRLQLQTVPTESADEVLLDPLRIRLAAGDTPALDLSGQLRWQGGMRMRATLDGSLQTAHGDYATALRWPAAATSAGSSAQGAAHLTFDGPTAHLDLRADPARLLAWWQQLAASTGQSLALPPMRATLTADNLVIGSLHIEGMRVSSGLPAVAGSSAGTPAVAGSAP